MKNIPSPFSFSIAPTPLERDEKRIKKKLKKDRDSRLHWERVQGEKLEERQSRSPTGVKSNFRKASIPAARRRAAILISVAHTNPLPVAAALR